VAVFGEPVPSNETLNAFKEALDQIETTGIKTLKSKQPKQDWL
jgi:hypothetical protein